MHVAESFECQREGEVVGRRSVSPERHDAGRPGRERLASAHPELSGRCVDLVGPLADAREAWASATGERDREAPLHGDDVDLVIRSPPADHDTIVPTARQPRVSS